LCQGSTDFKNHSTTDHEPRLTGLDNHALNLLPICFLLSAGSGNQLNFNKVGGSLLIIYFATYAAMPHSITEQYDSIKLYQMIYVQIQIPPIFFLIMHHLHSNGNFTAYFDVM